MCLQLKHQLTFIQCEGLKDLRMTRETYLQPWLSSALCCPVLHKRLTLQLLQNINTNWISLLHSVVPRRKATVSWAEGVRLYGRREVSPFGTIAVMLSEFRPWELFCATAFMLSEFRQEPLGAVLCYSFNAIRVQALGAVLCFNLNAM